jgi:flagellar protein FlaJ
MPYFAAILLVSTTSMMIGFTAGTLGVGTPGTAKDLGPMVMTFTTSTIFHSYLIGLVAGKISEESIAAGFKHAAILVIVAVLAAKLVPMFIKF